MIDVTVVWLGYLFTIQNVQGPCGVEAKKENDSFAKPLPYWFECSWVCQGFEKRGTNSGI